MFRILDTPNGRFLTHESDKSVKVFQCSSQKKADAFLAELGNKPYAQVKGYNIFIVGHSSVTDDMLKKAADFLLKNKVEKETNYFKRYLAQPSVNPTENKSQEEKEIVVENPTAEPADNTPTPVVESKKNAKGKHS